MLKIYVWDHAWRGAAVVVAESLKQARLVARAIDLGRLENHGDDYSEEPEVYEIKSGIVFSTAGE